MTEDTDRQSTSNCSTTRNGGTNAQNEWTGDGWRSLSADPENTADLGYTLTNWEEFETLDKTDQTIFLPEDESNIEEAAFIVADDDAVLDLTDHY